MENKKNVTFFNFIISAIIIGLYIISNVVVLMYGQHVLTSIVFIILFILIVFYVEYEYMTPHGNLLKYLMLTFCLCLLIGAVENISTGGSNLIIVCFPVMMMVSYASGRLNKFNQVMVLLFISIIVLIGYSSYLATKITMELGGFYFFSIITAFRAPIALALITGSYYKRYNAHIEAGKNN